MEPSIDVRADGLDVSRSAVDLLEIFELSQLQRLQDRFASATGLASIITRPDGTPVTDASNFCRLCREVVRTTSAGAASCRSSDSMLGLPQPHGSTISRCASAGLWDAGAAIVVDGMHVGNWLVGQVRLDSDSVDDAAASACALGIDVDTFMSAYDEVEVVSIDHFRAVADFLHMMADSLSQSAFLNRRQAILNKRLERMVEEVTRLLGKVTEARDSYTQGHQESVSLIARMLAERLGFSPDEVTSVEMCARVHDIGKLAVPTAVLNKVEPLSADEFALIKTHTEVGYDILKDVEFPWPLADVTLKHHERVDGSGYPQGLSGDELGLHVRIVVVSDVIDAMTNRRPYRPALGLEAAVDEIVSHPERYGVEMSQVVLDAYREGLFAAVISPAAHTVASS